jgi:hypothetical protein
MAMNGKFVTLLTAALAVCLNMERVNAANNPWQGQGHSRSSVSVNHGGNHVTVNTGYQQQHYQHPNYNNNYYHHRGNDYQGNYPVSEVVYPDVYADTVITTYDGNAPQPEVNPTVVSGTDGLNQDNYVVDTSSNNSETWVNASNGEVPNGAVPYSDENHAPSNNSFYCRGNYNGQLYSGELIANEGCLVDDNMNAATIRLQNYQVLVNNQ